MLIHHAPNGYWTGQSLEIGDRDPVPVGWIVAPPPPEAPSGQVAMWADEWVIVSAPAPAVLTLEEEREALFIRIGDYRREASQRLTFAGMSIFLDAKTEDAIHKGIKGLERSPPGTVIQFEIKPGYVTAMDLIWMEALGDAAFALVQACFSHSADLCEQAWAAETLEDLRAIDITTGWPS